MDISSCDIRLRSEITLVPSEKLKLRGADPEVCLGHSASDRAEVSFPASWALWLPAQGSNSSETQRCQDESEGCGFVFLSSSGREEVGQAGGRMRELVGERAQLGAASVLSLKAEGETC